MLRGLPCKIVLCQEACEIPDSSLLTAFLPSVEHIILIGDHHQLAPKIQNLDLPRENSQGGSRYPLEVSLFQRLVDSDPISISCGLPHSTLETQWRMHPSIAQLVRGSFYPKLKDAEMHQVC